MTKKIAFIFYGMPRLFDTSTQSLVQLVQKFNADVFVHTWKTENDQVELEKIIHLFNPISVKMDNLIPLDTAPYENRKWPSINVYNTLSSWVSTQRAYQLMENYYSAANKELPDIIIKTRFDVYIDNFDLIDTGTLVLPMVPRWTTHMFHFKDQLLIATQDVLCYGPSKAVKIYCDLIDHIPQIMDQCNEIPFVSEHILASHLWLNHLPYYSQLLYYNLVRS